MSQFLVCSGLVKLVELVKFNTFGLKGGLLILLTGASLKNWQLSGLLLIFTIVDFL